MNDLGPPFARYRQRFVARKGADFVAVPAADAAYFLCDDKLTFVVSRDGGRFRLDAPLGEIEPQLPPHAFFRLNRQYLAGVHAIASFRPIGRGKLLVELVPSAKGEVIVSQERAAAFRAWLSQ